MLLGLRTNPSDAFNGVIRSLGSSRFQQGDSDVSFNYLHRFQWGRQSPRDLSSIPGVLDPNGRKCHMGTRSAVAVPCLCSPCLTNDSPSSFDVCILSFWVLLPSQIPPVFCNSILFLLDRRGALTHHGPLRSFGHWGLSFSQCRAQTRLSW